VHIANLERKGISTVTGTENGNSKILFVVEATGRLSAAVRRFIGDVSKESKIKNVKQIYIT
jgi:hypothetical protein